MNIQVAASAPLSSLDPLIMDGKACAMRMLREFLAKSWMLLGPAIFWFGGMGLMGFIAAMLLHWRYDVLAGWAALSWPIIVIASGLALDGTERGRAARSFIGKILSLS